MRLRKININKLRHEVKVKGIKQSRIDTVEILLIRLGDDKPLKWLECRGCGLHAPMINQEITK